MKKTLLILMAVAVVVVGCAKENPPKPEPAAAVGPDPRTMRSLYTSDEEFRRDLAEYDAAARAEKATTEWYNSLVVCLHCGSDLARKGAKTCAECGRDQHP